MKVRDIMTASVQACQLATDLAGVAKLMWDHDCGFIPVVDAAGALVGVITDRDICMAASTRRLAPEHIQAAQAMSGPVRACLPGDTLESALAVMKEYRVRRLAVIDENGRLRGVIAMNDAVLAAELRKAVPAKQIVSTMAAICEHRTMAPAAAKRHPVVLSKV